MLIWIYLDRWYGQSKNHTDKQCTVRLSSSDKRGSDNRYLDNRGCTVLRHHHSPLEPEDVGKAVILPFSLEDTLFYNHRTL